MAYLANWNVFQWTDKRYGHLQVEEKVSATNRRKDLFKFELLVAVNHIFIKWRAKSLCVMLQNNSSYIEMFWIKSQITCSKIWKTGKRILLEQCGESWDKGNQAGGALSVHRQAADPGSGRDLGCGCGSSQKRRTRCSQAMIDPVSGCGLFVFTFSWPFQPAESSFRLWKMWKEVNFLPFGFSILSFWRYCYGVSDLLDWSTILTSLIFFILSSSKVFHLAVKSLISKSPFFPLHVHFHSILFLFHRDKLFSYCSENIKYGFEAFALL